MNEYDNNHGQSGSVGGGLQHSDPDGRAPGASDRRQMENNDRGAVRDLQFDIRAAVAWHDVGQDIFFDTSYTGLCDALHFRVFFHPIFRICAIRLVGLVRPSPIGVVEIYGEHNPWVYDGLPNKENQP
jgi:hypothetical protein